MVAMDNIHVYLKYGKIASLTTNKKFIFQILLLVVVIVQFRTLYLNEPFAHRSGSTMGRAVTC